MMNRLGSGWWLAVRILGAPLFALLAAVAATLRSRAVAMRRASADPAAAWFGYIRFLQLLDICLWVLWTFCVLCIPVDLVLWWAYNRFPAPWGNAVLIALYFLPPTFASALCLALSRPVFTALGGRSYARTDVLAQSAVIVLRVFSAAAWLFAILAVTNQFWGVGVVSLAVRTMAVSACGLLNLRAFNLGPVALTTGPLRDRVFEMASVAKVKLDQVYLLRSGPSRLVNAFAYKKAIAVSATLVEQLPRREVDAVIAHELAHIVAFQHAGPRRRRIWDRLALLLCAVLAVAAFTAIVAMGDSTHFHPTIWTARIGWPLLMVAILIVRLYLSRRREFKTDAVALEILNDPEAQIASLVRITALNNLPMAFGRGSEGALTHPSTLRRVEAIARRGGVPPARLEEILAHPDTVGDYYPLPAESPGGPRLYSTLWKRGYALAVSWSAWAAFLFIAGGTVRFGRTASLASSRPEIYAGGFVVAALTYVAAEVTVGSFMRRRLARRAPSGEGLLTGLSPGKEVRLFEGLPDWDVGRLSMRDGILDYNGEEAAFRLPASHVEGLSLVSAADLPPMSRVAVHWRSGETAGSFTLAPWLDESPRAARALLDKVEALRTGKASPDGEFLVLPPTIPATSKPPRASRALAVSNLLATAILGGAGAALWSLPFTLSGGGLIVVAIAVAWPVLAVPASIFASRYFVRSSDRSTRS